MYRRNAGFGPDHQDAGLLEPLPVGVEQVGGAVQPDRGLAGAGRALHADRGVQTGPDQVVRASAARDAARCARSSLTFTWLTY